MKSIKPGRGPSMMNGFMGIVVILFGVFWTIIVGRFAPFMAVFGILFIIIAVVQTIYSFKNATSKNRYSSFDITDSSEEIDPFNERYGNNETKVEAQKGHYCPYCGEKLDDDFVFCRYCGKKIKE